MEDQEIDKESDAKEDGNKERRTQKSCEEGLTVGELQETVSKMEDELLRTRAEMQNMQKRLAREKESMAKFALSGFAKDILPVRDNLELALASCKDSDDKSVLAIANGVEMTLKTLDKILGDHGVHLIEALGQPFDPAYHQAMSQVESDGKSGVVLQVVQAGFMIQDRLLRPAMVIVAR